MKSRVLFIGPISPPVSGPGVKNTMMIKWLKENSDFKLTIINTIKSSFTKHLFSSLFLIFRHKVIILSVSKNGRFLFIPILYMLRKKVLLFPAGGTFDDEINSLPLILKKIFLKCTSAISYTYPQTKKLENGLRALKFKKIKYFPNPRIIHDYKAPLHYEDSFKIIFISKIRETKGPLLLINAVEELRKKNSDITIKLDFYGLIENEFKERFFNVLSQNKLNRYCNLIQPKDVQKIISKYNLFVLPTFYKGEGVPGALLEAMMTAIPIITTDFTGVNELITNYKEGLIIQQNSNKELIDAINLLIKDEKLRSLLSKNVMLKAQEFNIDNLMPTVLEDIVKINK